ncbi:DUF1365 domain-containing protein [Thalassotalea ponticola]|uniref:DUF1365 domain-containing protein n=1 Tax=Thalassotalea ponticola TaxID=1523392 RepID=UPI0025B4EA37|nr:DUF1365 domain-containing protein [Thalassotalea ponticola]MDN3651926.1 DUF1365 domain-containing protein [Thalassotalea ponticola]
MAQYHSSQVYRGTVRHRRFTPKAHHFNYQLYMLALNVDDVTEQKNFGRIFGYKWFNPVRFVEQDYVVGELGTLRQRICKKVASLGGSPFDGDIVMLVQARCFGLYFSPANFYFCYHADSEQCRYMLAEVSNTPWNERHYYLIDMQQEKITDKNFHVSPFMDLAMQYHWRIKPPSNDDSKLLIHIDNKRDSGDKVFDATLALQALPLSAKHMFKVWLQLPAMTLKVVAGIYYQAAKLLLKRIKFIPYQHGQ